jgi:hypothetical protein
MCFSVLGRGTCRGVGVRSLGIEGIRGRVIGVVVSFAINVNHVGDGLFFAYHAFVGWVWWLGLHVSSVKILYGLCVD